MHQSVSQIARMLLIIIEMDSAQRAGPGFHSMLERPRASNQSIDQGKAGERRPLPSFTNTPATTHNTKTASVRLAERPLAPRPLRPTDKQADIPQTPKRTALSIESRTAFIAKPGRVLRQLTRVG